MPKKLFHSWGEWQIDPFQCMKSRTCTKPNCEYCYEEREDHEFDDWKYFRNDSCEMVRKCSRCNKEELMAGEHDYSQWDYHTSGSCEKRRICKRCNHAEYRIEHQFANPILREEECIEQKICRRCSYIIVNQADHDWSPVLPYKKCIQQALGIHQNRKEHLLHMLNTYKNNDQQFFACHSEVAQINQRINALSQKNINASEDEVARICKHCNYILYLGRRNVAKAKTGFLSYSHNEMQYSCVIHEALKNSGINIIRDVEDINIGEHLQQFMNRVAESDYIILILSDAYLQSANCMYEAVQVVLKCAKGNCKLIVFSIGINISSRYVKEKWLKYWQERCKEAIQQMESAHDTQIYSNIRDNIWEFMNLVTEYKYEYIEAGEPIAEHLLYNMVRQI